MIVVRAQNVAHSQHSLRSLPWSGSRVAVPTNGMRLTPAGRLPGGYSHASGTAISFDSGFRSQESERVPVSNDQLTSEILGIFAEKLAIDVESATVDLLDTGLVDSVTLVELLLELEKRFGVVLPLEELEMEDFRSVTRIAELVARTQPTHERLAPVVPPANALGSALADALSPASGAAA